MAETPHGYDLRVPNDRIRDLIREEKRPWREKVVLQYLHQELNMSLAEIGNVFGVTRQAVAARASELDIEVHRKYSNSKAVDSSQKILGDYQKTGLEDFL